MIEFKKCPVIDGVAYASVAEAQIAQIKKLVVSTAADCTLNCDVVAKWIVDNADKVIDTLTTNEHSKPSARKINGGTKKRKGTVTPLAQNP